MRRQLILVFVAISVMVALAFVVPLAFLVRSTAADRALDSARADAAAVVPVLVSDGSRIQIESAIGATDSGRDNRMTVLSRGWTIGVDAGMSDRLEEALNAGLSATGEVDGGSEVVTAVASGPGELSAVRVFVPNEALRSGQWKAWTALAAVAVFLVSISVVVADQLARSIVRPTQTLASAANRLGAGDLEARVEPAGPPELVELAGAFNDLGSQVSSMLTRERELVAELSHRLRTPLTKLRMRLDHVNNESLATELRSDLDDITVVVNDLIAEARSSLTTESVETCDAAAVLTDRVEFWAVLAEDQQRAWTFNRRIGSLPVAMQASALAAAVDVVVENVFAHTPEGTSLVVGCSREGGHARIWVGDAGDGFDGAALARGVSGNGSTGLGLDIPRSTADDVGGSFHVGQSDLGGSEIVLLLPLALDQSV